MSSIRSLTLAEVAAMSRGKGVRCQVALEADSSGVVSCGAEATHYVTGWGHGPGRDGMHVCRAHADEARQDGASVDV